VVAVSHVLFIDEAGNAQPGPSVQSLWVTAAVAIPFERARDLNEKMDDLRRQNLRSRVKEVKGSQVPHELLRGRTVDNLAAGFAALLRQFDAHVWIVLASRQQDGPTTKGAARQLVLERVNGFLNLGRYHPAHWLIVWDVSDVQELADFSKSVSQFTNAFSGSPRNDRLFPSILGGLSHDWGGLQAADLAANLALHFRGSELGFADASAAKAAAFKQHLWPCLQTTASGAVLGCGWKTW
jgi:hypothetical protein